MIAVRRNCLSTSRLDLRRYLLIKDSVKVAGY